MSLTTVDWLEVIFVYVNNIGIFYQKPVDRLILLSIFASVRMRECIVLKLMNQCQCSLGLFNINIDSNKHCRIYTRYCICYYKIII